MEMILPLSLPAYAKIAATFSYIPNFCPRASPQGGLD